MEHLLRQFIRYVSLNILGMVGFSCYILADTFFIANGVGPMALAALNIALPLYALLGGVSQMIALGASTKYSIYKAQGEDEKANHIFTDGFKLSFLIGLIFMLATLFFSEPICRALGADDTIVGLSSTYLRTMMVFSPFFALEYLFTAFMRNDNAPGLATAAMIAGSLFNVIFDYVFMYPMDLGLWGAALATGFSPVAGLSVASLHLIKKQNSFHLAKPLYRLPRLESLFVSCRLGVSALIVEISNGVVLLVFNKLMLSLAGNIGVAAYGVVANISIVVISIFTGITTGLQPLASSCYGKGQHHNVHKLTRYALILSSALAVIFTVTGFLAAEPITALFNSENNAELAAIASHGINLYFTGFLFAGINLVLGAVFAAIEDARKAFIVSMCRGLAVIVPAAFLMAALFGLDGLWLSFLVTEVITAVISVTFWIREKARVARSA